MKQKILIVDDEENNILLVSEILKSHYKLLIARNGQQAVDIAQSKLPDLILMDITMPDMDGMQACQLLKKTPATSEIPLIFVTALSGMTDESKGFDIGAVDYIHKPISAPILLRRIKTHLSLVNVEKLNLLARESIHMLGEAGHYNDTDTGVHIWRMANYASCLAKAIGWEDEECNQLELAAPMHDTGKIGIPDNILKAKRKLTSDEWVLMKKHSRMGHDILIRSQHPVFQIAAIIALNHHEKWDGSGYPQGLAGEDIPQAARIVAIADVFDALTMKRPYKEAWTVEASLALIKKDAGKHFDPRLVDVFLSIQDEILEIKTNWDKQEQKKEDGFS